MTRLTLPSLCAAALGAAVAHAATATPPAKEVSPRAAALVRQLGHTSFTVRERASMELVEMGRTARPALVEGFKDPDLEIRRRCRFILPLALKHDLEGRLAAFLSDRDLKRPHDLPGWTRYRQILGADTTARQLYAEMVRADGALLEAAERERPAPRLSLPFELPFRKKDAAADSGPDPETASAGELFGARCQILQQLMYNPTGQGSPTSLSDVAVLLFVGTEPKVNVPPQAIWQLTSLLTYQFSNQFNSPAPRNQLVRRLLLRWITQRTDANSVGQTLELAIRLNLKEGLEIALKELRSKNGMSWNKGHAIMAIGKLGGKEHIPLLESLLNDKGQVGGFGINNIQGMTEVRDVALATLVHKSGQSLKDYGFAAAEIFGGFENLYSSPGLLGFENQQKRDAAIKKYREYAAKQKGRQPAAPAHPPGKAVEVRKAK